MRKQKKEPKWCTKVEKKVFDAFLKIYDGELRKEYFITFNLYIDPKLTGKNTSEDFFLTGIYELLDGRVAEEEFGYIDSPSYYIRSEIYEKYKERLAIND